VTDWMRDSGRGGSVENRTGINRYGSPMYLTPVSIDKGQAANLICQRFDLVLSSEQREELMQVLTLLVKHQEEELERAAKLRDQLGAALAEMTPWAEAYANLIERVR
jgi:hypothetical protein